MNEEFENINSVVSENASDIVSGSSDLEGINSAVSENSSEIEEINSIEDTVNNDIVSSGSLSVSESGSFSSGSNVYNYYILSHDPDSGSVSSDQNVQPIVQFPSGVDYSEPLEHLTDIHMYILLFTILIFIVSIFYRFRIKGGMR